MPDQIDNSTGSDRITWASLPVRDEPRGKSLLLVGVMFAVAALASLQGGLLLGGLALLLLFILLGPYFLPCRFEVSDEGVKKRFPLFSRDRKWSDYKRFVVQMDGVFLGTFPVPSRLDSFRGDFLRFSAATDREGVIALVRKHMGDQ